jgi:hypothetical protein
MLPKPIPGSWNSVKLCKWVELFCSLFMRLLMGKFLSVFRMVEFAELFSPCQPMVPFWNGPANNDFENFFTLMGNSRTSSSNSIEEAQKS